MSGHHHYYLLRNLADASEPTRKTWFNGFHLNDNADTALFVFFTCMISIILVLYGMSLMQCLRMMFCPETVRRRPPTMMMDIDPGLKNLNKRQRRAVIQTFFSVKSVNVINLADKKCADEDNIDNR